MSDVIKLTKKLIKIESTDAKPDKLKEVLELAKKELTGFEYKSFGDAQNDNIKPSLLFYNTKTLPKKFKLLLNAHLDVVPADKSMFTPIVKDGKLFGRGAMDMKSGAACEIIAFKELAKKIDYPMGLQLVTDEEVGGKCTEQQVGEGVRADFVIIGESTGLQIRHASKNPHWIKLIVKGVSAHGAYPWLGQNALVKLTHGLNKLLEHFPIPSQESWQTTITVSKIYTPNEVTNRVPDYAEAILDIRTNKEDNDGIIPKIKEIVGPDFELEEIINEVGYYTEPDNKYLKTLQAILPEGKKELARASGGCDLRFYERVNCKGIEFGPTGEGYHSDREYIDMQSVEDYYQILKEFLLAIN